MVYILWAVHTGIICGCQLYEVAVLTSIFVTLILLVLMLIATGTYTINKSFFKKEEVFEEIKGVY